ncbi:hypothetical protein [Rhodococcoides corynebacterioides]|uniref:Uncharacterized protein n=1 Tax=Rhodococcoides corynebacterioides TaxID=53972 RepID=A0ABS7P0Y7_9NOCA|nr:hypothetical protein [Rhodococcus corynebacterioides]MBY6350618.1 hypothetical protein [Rhodococcus corynebacterioides]MBY6366072.1 hypothetical protein [Rhodococcus corynebacterioides]MBY6406970.1 hypothetical protein [Rhodococcus corynebacterioides]
MDSRAGLVFVDHDQFAIGRADADTMNVAVKGTLLEAGSGFVGVYTGVSYGPARVIVDVLDAAPDVSELESWEVVEETVLTSAEPLVVMSLNGSIVDDIGSIPSGTYTVRCHAVGRDTHTGLEVTDATETYYFQLWPSAYPNELTVRTLRKIDRAWSREEDTSHEPTRVVPEPDFNYVYVRATDGEVRRVDRHSVEADSAREWRREHGGRPLSADLKATTYARFVASLDRDLLDRIAASDGDTQLRFARWCAQRAFEKADMIHVPWLQELVEKLNNGTLDRKDLHDAKQRMDDDNAITLRLVTGLPGEPETVQQHQALLALEVIMLEDFSPLKIAVWSYRHASQTFGMEYPDLIRAANLAFPPD